MREDDLFDEVVRYCDGGWIGLVGESELVVEYENGDPHGSLFQSFFNSHDALTLAVHLGASSIVVDF